MNRRGKGNADLSTADAGDVLIAIVILVADGVNVSIWESVGIVLVTGIVVV